MGQVLAEVEAAASLEAVLAEVEAALSEELEFCLFLAFLCELRGFLCVLCGKALDRKELR